MSLNFVDAPEAPDNFNVLIYGPSGAGKSAAAATAPGPILWLNFEGPGALAYARRTAAERGSEIHEVRIEHDQDPRPILRSAVEHIRSGAEPQVATLVVDTIGKVRDQTARAIGGDQPSIQQWGSVAKVMESFVRLGRDLPVNFVLIAHEEIKEDATGENIIRPAIGGATEKVVAEMDVVGYAGRVETEQGARYMAQLVQRGGRRAKDRSDGLGTVRDMDLSVWLQVFREALTPGYVAPGEPPLALVGGDAA